VLKQQMPCFQPAIASAPAKVSGWNRCHVDVTVDEAASHGVAGSPEYCKRAARRTSGSRRLSRSRSFRRRRQVRPHTVRHQLSKVVSSSRELHSPTECSQSLPAPYLSAKSAFHGVPVPLRGMSKWPSCDGFPRPSLSRPRRFTRPRRITAPPASWVYFTPLPRPGFALQGFSLPRSRTVSSTADALSSLATPRCRQLPTSATKRRPAHRAFIYAGVRHRRTGF